MQGTEIMDKQCLTYTSGMHDIATISSFRPSIAICASSTVWTKIFAFCWLFSCPLSQIRAYKYFTVLYLMQRRQWKLSVDFRLHIIAAAEYYT